MEEERHQPLPGFTALPAWAWRKMNRAARAAVVLVALALVALGIWLAPRITASKREHAAADARAQAAAVRADRARRVKDQRLHLARTWARTVAGATRALEADIRSDLRARQRAGLLPPPPVRRVFCRPMPEDPRYRDGLQRLKCIGATSDVTATVVAGFEVLGAVRPRTGRLFWCKTNPEAGEKANGAQLADVPLAVGCFGGLRPGEHQVGAAR